MKNITLAIATTLIIAPTLALAKNDDADKATGFKYSGPVELSTVASLLEDTSMFTEKNVVVDGQLIRRIDDDTFIFSDGSSEIQVEIDDDIYIEQPINHETKVRLFGEYEGGSTPEIEVDSVQIL